MWWMASFLFHRVLHRMEKVLRQEGDRKNFTTEHRQSYFYFVECCKMCNRRFCVCPRAILISLAIMKWVVFGRNWRFHFGSLVESSADDKNAMLLKFRYAFHEFFMEQTFCFCEGIFMFILAVKMNVIVGRSESFLRSISPTTRRLMEKSVSGSFIKISSESIIPSVLRVIYRINIWLRSTHFRCWREGCFGTEMKSSWSTIKPVNKWLSCVPYLCALSLWFTIKTNQFNNLMPAFESFSRFLAYHFAH